MWAGGPKFATENVATKINFTEACKTGDEYVWGANWRTPTRDELTFVNAKEGDNYTYTLTPLNTKAEVGSQGGVIGILYTGIQPGYTDKTLFLPLEGSADYAHAVYWASTVKTQGYGTSLSFLVSNNVIYTYHLDDKAYAAENTKYLVRPVLAE